MRVRTTAVFLVVVAGATALAQIEAPRPKPPAADPRPPAAAAPAAGRAGPAGRAGGRGPAAADRLLARSLSHRRTRRSRSTTGCASSSTRIIRRRSWR